jgi:DNA gyrase subunit A
LSEGDETVGMSITSDGEPQVLAICEKGYGKRTPLPEFRPQNRGGKGIILIDASDRNGPVVGIALVRPDQEIMLVTDRGQTLRTKVNEIRETGRNAQGVRVMTIEEGERVVAVEGLAESDEVVPLSVSPEAGEGSGEGAPSGDEGSSDPGTTNGSGSDEVN